MSQIKRKSRGKRVKNVKWGGDARRMRNRYKAKVYRQVKDRLFRFLFEKNKDALLQLYNALNGTDYRDVSGMEIVTIESAVYVAMNNDAAFIFAGTLSLYEHQSTMNINMPVPKCVVFYNGEKDAGEDAEESWEMCLSDAFVNKTNSTGINADVEVRAHVLNINYGHNKELMEKCPLLGEYSRFVAVSREYLSKGMERQEAYETAIDYCIEHDILKKYLQENRVEVIGMLLREFDVEKYERSLREEGREEGLAEAGELIRRLLSRNNIKDLDLEDGDRKLLREMGI